MAIASSAMRHLRLEWRRDFNRHLWLQLDAMRQLTSLTLFGVELETGFLSGLLALEDRLGGYHD
jgi:hypothetical protein